MPRFPISEWQAEQARMTVFPMPGETARLTEWWRAVTDGEPDETTIARKLGTVQVQGVFGPGKLILRMDPERIDWILALREEDIYEVEEFPRLGPAMQTFGELSAVVHKWLARNDLPAVERIAFGAVLKHHEADLRTAYLRLPDYVPVRVDPDSRDFLYQINVPAPSATGIEGLRLNRLSKWMVAAYVGYNLTSGGPRTLSHLKHLALRLEVDVNTLPDFGRPIPAERLVDVYRELVASAEAIATDGVVTPCQ